MQLVQKWEMLLSMYKSISFCLRSVYINYLFLEIKAHLIILGLGNKHGLWSRTFGSSKFYYQLLKEFFEVVDLSSSGKMFTNPHLLFKISCLCFKSTNFIYGDLWYLKNVVIWSSTLICVPAPLCSLLFCQSLVILTVIY